MREPASLGQRRVLPRRRLIETSQAAEAERRLSQEGDQRIVGKHFRVEAPVGGIKKSEALLQILQSKLELAEVQGCIAAGVAAHQARTNVAANLAPIAHFHGELPRSLQLGSDRVIDPLAVELGQKLA